jgi:hypothetical protein
VLLRTSLATGQSKQCALSLTAARDQLFGELRSYEIEPKKFSY